MIQDIPFATVINEKGESETLTLDVYTPEKPTTTPRPALVLFHGGGFTFGNDKRQKYIVWIAEEMARRGYVTVSADYRLRQKPFEDVQPAIRDAVSDARLALAWVKEHSAEYGIDPTRIALGGGSAGGILLINMVQDPMSPIRAQDGYFAIIDLWGTPDPERNMQLFKDIHPDTPPTLIIHGTADQLVSFTASQNYQSALETCRIPVTLLAFEGLGHTPVSRIDEIYQTIDEFMQDQLYPKK